MSSAPRAGRRERIGLAVIALPCLLYSMDLTVLNLALPSLSADRAAAGACGGAGAMTWGSVEYGGTEATEDSERVR